MESQIFKNPYRMYEIKEQQFDILYEKLRNQSLVLTNLTNLLLLNNQYIDTLYWSNKGIEITTKEMT